ncbi:transposase [Streptomyces sp. NPDC052396]|uniref:transposase n=1 Tax=Streptomyces sp. NPDC052396 TaxID=3365689 RepID=UPI0037D31E39
MIVRYGCGSCEGPGPRWAVEDSRAVDTAVPTQAVGGGKMPVADRKVFTAVVYALTSGCAWRYLPPMFGTSPATAHRRFIAWTKAGLWRRLHRAVLDELGARGELDWTSVIIDARPVIAGTQQLLLHTLPEGVEQAVANFHRYARRIGQEIPEVVDASKLFQLHQQAWASGSEVTAGTPRQPSSSRSWNPSPTEP